VRADPTPSPLAWHQSPTTDFPWYGTFLPQVLAFMLLVGVFGVVGAIWVWGHTLGRKRKVEPRSSLAWNSAGLAAISGLAAIVLGTIAMAEFASRGFGNSDMMLAGEPPRFTR
jgi:hypothetical protein